MNPQWQEFLLSEGARIEAGQVVAFGDAEDEARAAHKGDALIADLSHLALAAASGDDAQGFLQSMLSNDVRRVGAEESQLSALLSPKGRMLALFRLFQREEGYLLLLPRDVAEGFLKRLRMFVLRAKVVIKELSDEWARFAATGDEAGNYLKGHFGALPEVADGCLTRDGVTLIRLRGAQARYEIHGPAGALVPLWTGLREAGCRPAGATAWELTEIAAGVPTVHAATVEAFVPQMANLEELNGVSFTKGCYPGQEVVARSQYLGKLKRRLYRARLATGEVPAPGDTIEAPGAAGTESGKVVRAAAHPEGGAELLAILPIAAVESGNVHLGDRPLQFLELPYALSATDATTDTPHG